MTEESALLKAVLLQASRNGEVLFRNQVGTYHLADGRFISSGLCVGSSDLIGWTPVKITQEMVGKTVAVFTAIECKSTSGWPVVSWTPDMIAIKAEELRIIRRNHGILTKRQENFLKQETFLQNVRAGGGIAKRVYQTRGAADD